jgi:Protein of unknown function (DUF3095)
MDSSRFYADLATHTVPVSELLGDEAHFSAVPEDWRVIITDVRKSTQALSDGKHQLVNLVAAGSIIAALNIAHRVGISLPFFFGGDGATLLSPPSLAHAIEHALLVHRENTRANFGLDLRVGSVGLNEIYRQDSTLRIAKVDVNRGLVIPVALGVGLQAAEKAIKHEDYARPMAQPDTDLDLAGMECRWDRIGPPENTEEVVCLLLGVCDPRRQAAVLSAVLAEIDGIYGPLSKRSPVSLPRLNLKMTPGKINTEMRVKLGRFDFAYFAEHWFRTLIGGLYFRFNPEGARYLQDLVQWSDTLMIDGRINTVMSGTVAQRNALMAVLRSREAQGEIVFGMQSCTASVMSCYVRDRRDQHIHFIDGLGGGYTRAAIMLKSKLAQQAVKS